MARRELEFIIPISPSKEECDKYNEQFNTNVRCTDELIEEAVLKIFDEIYACMVDGGAYISDDVKVTVQMEYRPENK